jgi:hypothetical protein
MGMVGLAGVVLGAIVLTVFPRSIQSAQSINRLLKSSPATQQATSFGVENSASNAPGDGERTSTGASRELGGYVRQATADLEGRYVCFRPSFGNQAVINSYIVIIRWDERRSCLVFEEQNRPDSVHTQKGLVYVPDGKPFFSLVTMDNGSVRLVTVARPENGIARGLVMTLSNPQGTHFTPAAAPVVLRRLDETTPQLGFIHRGAPDYDLYAMQLSGVAPYFGIFANAPDQPSGVGASAEPELTGALT